MARFLHMIDRIILGTVQLGLEYGIANTSGKPDQHEADRIIRTAWQKGISFFDTALGYGDSESVLGTALKNEADPSRAHVITKLPVNLDSPGGLLDNVEGSIQRLKISKLYCLMLHREEHLSLLHGAVGRILRGIQESSRTEHIGVSVYTPEGALQALRNELVSVVQIPTSLFDRRFVNAGVVDAAIESGKELHVRSVFLQGVLAMNPDTLPEYLGAMKPALVSLQKVCARFGCQPLEAALCWVLKKLPTCRVIFGAETAHQVAQNASNAIKCSCVPQSFFDELDAVFPVQSEKLLNPALWRR